VIPQQHRKKAAIAAICVACIAPAEGLRRVAYSDPVGIPTYCFGETQRPDGTRVQLGDHATTEECKGMLELRVERDFIPGVERCITRSTPDRRKAAFVSLAYNIGVDAFCKSSWPHRARRSRRRQSRWRCRDRRCRPRRRLRWSSGWGRATFAAACRISFL
jgi:GH24 family phage-related lysozyme (muramidase)